MKKIILFWLSLSALLPPAGAQSVWPGDVNDNGIVNTADLLYLGVAFGATGPERAVQGTDWEPFPLPSAWPQDFPNGLNFAYADCNGDGLVDEDDIDDAIEDNFGLLHGVLTGDGYTAAAPGTGPRLRLAPSATLVEEGAVITVDLELGSPAMPVEQFYGISFLYSYEPELLAGDDGLDFEDETEGSWITDNEDELAVLQIDDEDNATGEIGITRTNQLPVSGFGKIASFSIVIEDIIVGLTVDTFRMRIDSILLFDGQGGVMPAVTDTLEIIVARDTALVTSLDQDRTPGPVTLYPNPAPGRFILESDAPVEHLQLLDAAGRTAPLVIERRRAGRYHLFAPQAAPGFYLLSGRRLGRPFAQKVIIIKP